MNHTHINDRKYIDIPLAIEKSNSKLLKALPKFIVRGITKIVRQDQMNRALNKYSECEGKAFLDRMIEELNLTLEVEGKENLPESGRCIFAANHPFGIVDGLVLTHTVSEKYGELKAIANDVFMLIPHLHPFIAAVDVFKGTTKAYLKGLDEVYSSNVPITHFPSGRVSRRIGGKVQDLPWQKSFIAKAISSQRDIVPLYFFGRNSNLFYAIHNLRSMLGIKLTLELILLPREMFRKRNATIRVRIGKPIPYQSLDSSRSHHEWAQEIRSQLYDLGKN